jgi:hypothetical protein
MRPLAAGLLGGPGLEGEALAGGVGLSRRGVADELATKNTCVTAGITDHLWAARFMSKKNIGTKIEA